MKYFLLSWSMAAAASLFGSTFPAPYFSDAFSRTNLTPCTLGASDNSKGGAAPYYYIPIFPEGGTNVSKPVGAIISQTSLQNAGSDFGGVQFSLTPDPCNGARGSDLGQDLYIGMSVLVPADSPGDISYAGPYFRSRAAAPGDGIIGGTSAGFWVQLLNTGEIRVVRLNPAQIIAVSPALGAFDPSIYHTLQIDVQTNILFVSLDEKLQSFRDANGLGGCDNAIILPDAGPGNQGTAGIAFGTDNRGLIGGQRADNLVVAPFSGALAGLPRETGASRVIATNETVLIQGSNATASQSLEACGFINHGIIRLTAIDSGWGASLIADAGYLTNANDGLVEILPGSGGPRSISADIINIGAFRISQDLSLTRSDGLLNNNGSLDLATNVTLRFDQQGGQALNQNAGTFNLNSNSAILGYRGQFNQNGGVLNVSSNVALTSLFFKYNGGQINGAADFFDTDLSLSSATTNAALFTLLGANRLLSNIPARQTLSLLGANRGASSALTSTNGFSNHGVLRLESVDSGWGSSLVVNNGTLTNDLDGVIQVNPGAGGPRSITAHLLNQGILEIGQDLQIIQPLDNEGTVKVATNVTLGFERQGGQVLNQKAGTFSMNSNSAILGYHGQFNQNGGVLNVSSNVALTSLGFNYNGGQINGAADFFDTDLSLNHAASNAALFTLLGANRLLSDVPARQTLSLLGANRGASSTLTSTNGFSNHGVLRLESVDSGWGSSLVVNNGTLTNDLDGIIQVNPGAGGPRSITAHLLNQGILEIGQDLQIIQPLDNEGTVKVATNVTLGFERQGGQVLNQNAGTFSMNSNSAVLGYHGQFNQNGGVLSVSSNVALTSLVFNYNGGQINGAADFFDTDLSLNHAASNAALFTLLGANRLLSDLPAKQTILLLGANRGASATLTSTNGFSNHGLLRMESMDSGWGSSLIINNGTLTNGFDGTIQVNPGAGGPRSITAHLLNQGALRIAQDLQIIQPLDNEGSIDLATNVTLGFERQGGQVLNQNAGTFTLNSNSAILGFHGQFNQNGGILNVSSNVALTSLAFNYNGGQINGAADFFDTDLRLSPSAGNAALFTLLGANRLLSDLPAKQTILLLGANRGASATLTSTNGFSNHGLLRLESVDSGWGSSLVVNNGALTNESDGAIQINRGAGGPRNIDAVLVNRGTINVNSDLTLARQGAAHDNRGTINVLANSTLSVNGQLTQSNGQISLSGGVIQGASPLILNGGILSGNGRVASEVQNINGSISAIGGDLGISGALTQNSSSSITFRTKGAPSVGTDRLLVDGLVKLAGTLNVQAPADYTPHVGDRFVLLTGQSISGVFGTVITPPPTNQTVWQPVYLPASVEVRIAYATNAVIFTEAKRRSSGEFEFSFVGVANTSYSIEASQDLINWAPLTNFVQSSAPFPFVDSGATNRLFRFYRARSQ